MRSPSGSWVALVAALTCTTAFAEEDRLTVSLGARAWLAEWTTFSYFTDEAGLNNLALTQVSAPHELVLVPLASLQYGNFVASMSVFPETEFHFANGDRGTRSEFDINVGYAVLPGLNVTLGYKKVSQRDGEFSYEPAGLVLGVYGSAPLSSGFSLYGSVGLGKLKTPQSGGANVVKFDADYRLTEIGLAYTLAGVQVRPRWTVTAGYRIQVMSSKEAFGTQDGRDTTQGLGVAAIASF